MHVLVHNPSTVDMKLVRIAVPHGNFDVKNATQELKAMVLCSEDYINDSCFLEIE